MALHPDANLTLQRIVVMHDQRMRPEQDYDDYNFTILYLLVKFV